jgi:hypothetical protein
MLRSVDSECAGCVIEPRNKLVVGADVVWMYGRQYRDVVGMLASSEAGMVRGSRVRQNVRSPGPDLPYTHGLTWRSGRGLRAGHAHIGVPQEPGRPFRLH